MPDPISISKTLSIRECGLEEKWLQDQIANNPSILGTVLDLDELDLVERERPQPSGGRLDLLLKDPDDYSMYEVEVMLGETNESHIIRTIEYWGVEQRRNPQREHFPVLVAESFSRRFFDVIYRFSLSIPLIAIQANIIEADGKRILHLTRILAIYEEPEDEKILSNETHDENWWRAKSAWTIDNAKALFAIVSPLYPVELNYVKNYIALSVNNNNYFGFHSRSGNKSQLWFWVSDSHLPQVAKALDEKSIPYEAKRKYFRLTVDKKTIEANAELFRELATLVKQSWQS